MMRLKQIAFRNWPNLIINRLLHPVPSEILAEQLSQKCNYTKIDIDTNQLKNWSNSYVPEWRASFGDIRHKKLIEFFCSYYLLKLHPNDALMDVAGGTQGYLKTVSVHRRILQDRTIAESTKIELGPNVDYIEGDANHILLPNASVDKISCHHAFEHFQGDSDIQFISEIKRILKPDGMCCIVPLLLTNRFIEITDQLTLGRKFSETSLRIIDPTSSLPGGVFSGNYARTYSLAAFNSRILDQLESVEWSVDVVEVLLDGRPAPYHDIECHKNVASVNFPYRCLLLKKERR